LAALLSPEFQPPLDQLGQILQLHFVLADEIGRSREILRVCQHELPGK
jgi:hypothetical protein